MKIWIAGYHTTTIQPLPVFTSPFLRKKNPHACFHAQGFNVR